MKTKDSGNRMPDKVHKMKILLTVIFCLSFSSGIFAGPDETEKLISAALQAGNATEVGKYFNAMVDLTLPGYDDTYSKAQASQILKEFFTKNQVKNFKFTNQGSSSDGSRYSIGSLDAGGKTYRVYFLIKSVNGQNLIQQLQMQENQQGH
ncbi:MAG: DUF4783 domain-containing protein [Bacteroidales bacterium]|jgi:hypothetical protein|nr:DUF4783 domain-containing protein [Bacteroidales bacterium]